MSASIAGNHVLADNVSMTRPMRNAPPVMTRPPGPGAAPIVVSATGLGTGGGVGVGGNADSAWGHLRVFVGLAPAGTGAIVLQWPVAPPLGAVGIVAMADWASIVVSGSNPYTLTWTALAPLVSNSQAIRIAYEWTVST